MDYEVVGRCNTIINQVLWITIGLTLNLNRPKYLYKIDSFGVTYNFIISVNHFLKLHSHRALTYFGLQNVFPAILGNDLFYFYCSSILNFSITFLNIYMDVGTIG